MWRAAAVVVLLLGGCGAPRSQPVVTSPRTVDTPPHSHEIEIDPRACSVTEGWRLTLDDAGDRDGRPAWLLSRTEQAQDLFGTWRCEIDARPHVGKYVRISAFTRTRGIRRAFFWIDQKGSPGLRPRIAQHQLAYESEWTRKEAVVQVTTDMVALECGAGTFESGHMWIDAPTIEVIGTEPPAPDDPLSDG